MNDEIWMEQIASEVEEADVLAPSRLKSRLYSRLILDQEQEGPLLGLTETAAQGRGLCVYEKLVEIMPQQPGMQSFQYCKICHARVAGETIESAPIYWDNCPYCAFQNR